MEAYVKKPAAGNLGYLFAMPNKTFAVKGMSNILHTPVIRHAGPL